jgi:TonB family protein
MRLRFLYALFFAVALSAHSQATANPEPGLLKNPREIIAVAEPFYDFTNAGLNPWHLKGSYQLYDAKGKPSEQGTFERWWASPQTYRTTWARPSGMDTVWHTADGKTAYSRTAASLTIFEYKLQSALFSPLPDAADLDPAKHRLDRNLLSAGGFKYPCIEVIPLMPQHGQAQVVPLGWFPTYCFEPKLPVLRVSYSLGRLTTEFNKVVKVQERFLPREILMLEGKKKILTAQVDEINGIAPADPALIPTKEALEVKQGKADLDGKFMTGMLLKKEQPIYPQDAKDAHVSGTVVLQAIIGRDGGIHDLRVISAPWASLAAEALWAVSHWQYKPYLLNGEPVEVETTVNVIYSLGQ